MAQNLYFVGPRYLTQNLYFVGPRYLTGVHFKTRPNLLIIILLEYRDHRVSQSACRLTAYVTPIHESVSGILGKLFSFNSLFQSLNQGFLLFVMTDEQWAWVGCIR